MGRAILGMIREPFVLSAAFSSPSNPNRGKTLREAGLGPYDLVLGSLEEAENALCQCDVLVSFSAPSADLGFTPLAAACGVPAVVGTTGFAPEERERLVSAAMGRIPLVMSANFSQGLAGLRRVLLCLAPLRDAFHVSIVEMHHAGKRDAPSGTALELADDLRGAFWDRGGSGNSGPRAGEIPIVALRGGGVPGEHAIILAGSHEVLRIEHRVFSRLAFAEGALLAARWAAANRPPGLYCFEDVLRDMPGRSNDEGTPHGTP